MCGDARDIFANSGRKDQRVWICDFSCNFGGSAPKPELSSGAVGVRSAEEQHTMVHGIFKVEPCSLSVLRGGWSRTIVVDSPA